jgi:hypothetical protein
LAALTFSIWLAARDSRIRNREDVSSRRINYKIAQDTFKDVCDLVHTADTAISEGSYDGKRFFSGAIDVRLLKNIDVLQHVVLSPLPSSYAAKDVQRMRILAFDALAAVERAESVLQNRSLSPTAEEAEARSALGEVTTSLDARSSMPRDAYGPRRSAWWKVWEERPS